MGVLRGDDLGQEHTRPTQWKMSERLEHPPEEERRLFEGDVLIEDVGQGIHEDDETDRLGGEQRRQAFTEERRELPAGKRPRQVDAPEEDFGGGAASLRHGDDGCHLKGQVPIDERDRAPGGHDSRGAAEGHPVHGGGSPHPDRARLRRDRRDRAQGQEIRPGWRQRVCSGAVVHGTASISTIC